MPAVEARSAPRTVVVSDLHLGSRTGRDVLRQPERLERLAGALAGARRVVLLGDVIELRHGPVRDALPLAEPVLRALGEAAAPDAEIVIVPGNHDHHLAAPWLERRSRRGGAPLMLENEVDWRQGETLATVVRWLGRRERVRAVYPGVWLRDDVYATHGHYADRHTTVPMFERLGAGAMSRIVREPAGGPRAVEDYEAVLAPLYAWIHAVAQAGGPELGESSHGASSVAWRALAGSAAGPRGVRRSAVQLRRRALAAVFPAAVGALNRVRLGGPLHADISGPELRRASLRAVGEVLVRLRVPAGHVVFGHTHRAGPLPPDHLHEFSAPTGARLHNCGCWVHEPGYLGPDPASSPYRAGFCVVLDGAGPPELVNVLDGAGPPELVNALDPA